MSPPRREPFQRDSERTPIVAMVEDVLDKLRPALDADGFDLRLESVGPKGQVRVVLEALEGACHDCLIPDALLVEILENSISETNSDVGEVVLIKRGF